MLARVPRHMQQAFRGRKTNPTQNVMVAVDFDLKDLSGALWDSDSNAILLDQEHYLGHCKVAL